MSKICKIMKSTPLMEIEYDFHCFVCVCVCVQVYYKIPSTTRITSNISRTLIPKMSFP